MRLILATTVVLAACSDTSLSKITVEPEVRIISHADGDTVLDGYSAVFTGLVADGDGLAEDLLVTWSVGDRVVCGPLHTGQSGDTTCSAVMGPGDDTITLRATDVDDMMGIDTVNLVLVPTEAPTPLIVDPHAPGPYYADQDIEFLGEVADAEDEPQQLAISWSSDLDGPLFPGATPDAAGQLVHVGRLSEGTQTLTLAVTDRSGQQGQTSVVFLVRATNTPPSCSIESPEAGSLLTLGTDVEFVGTAADPDLLEEQLAVTWSSDRDGLLHTQAPEPSGAVLFSTASLTAGTHVVSLEARDEQELGCVATVEVVVGTPPEVAILVPTHGDVLPAVGTVETLVALSDVEDGSELLTLAWSSDIDGPLVDLPSTLDGQVPATLGLTTLGAHLLTAVVTDTDGMTGEAQVGVVLNGRPTAPVVEIDPGDPVTGDGLSVVLVQSGVDPEGDALTLAAVWFEDGMEVATGTALPGGASFRGETWRVEVTVSDPFGPGGVGVAEVVIGNAPPSIGAVVLSPAPATETDVLTCGAVGTDDAEGDPVEPLVEWWVDGVQLGDTTPQLAAPSFARNQIVQCVATPHDGLDAGLPVPSNEVLIGGVPPTAPVIHIEPDPATTLDELTVVVDAPAISDAGLPLTYNTRWTRGAGVAASTPTLDPAHTGKGDIWTVELRAFDGMLEGPLGTASVEIVNTPPTVAGASLTPDPAFTDDGLTCTATGEEDVDGDRIEVLFAWWVNDVVVPETSHQLDGSWFAAHDVVRCEATPWDTEVPGVPALSNLVVIQNSLPEAYPPTVFPDPLKTNTQASCAGAGTTDRDGDAVSVAFTWTVNGVDVGWTGPTLSSGHYVRGDMVVCGVTPSDPFEAGAIVWSVEVPVVDAAPGPPQIQAQPSAPWATEDVDCTVTVDAVDPDGDAVTYTTSWSGPGPTVASSTLPAGSAESCELWTCTVTPWALGLAGASVSTSVTYVTDDACVTCGPAGDLDLDGVADADDNCPTHGNADQADEDGDGDGDVCDLCWLDGPIPWGPSLPWDDDGVTWSSVNLNGQGNTATGVVPGSVVSVNTTFTVFGRSCSYCPGCITQYFLGVMPLDTCAGEPGDKECVYSGASGCYGNSYRTVNATLVAPSEPGMYFVRPTWAWHYSCGQAGYSPNWGADQSVAAFCVQ